MRFLITVACLVAMGASPARSIELYRVVAEECRNSERPIVQTGFSFASGEAIYTALHGVAGCTNITAQRFDGMRAVETESELYVRLVDIERDIALLANERLNRARRSSTGLPSPGESLSIPGFPRGISQPDRVSVDAGTPPVRSLRTILGADMVQDFARVGSPALNIDVIRLDGNAQVGHSGAPLLDANEIVVGIVVGGFDAGEFGVSWAVPISDIEPTRNFDELDEVIERRHRFGMVIRNDDEPLPLPNRQWECANEDGLEVCRWAPPPEHLSQGRRGNFVAVELFNEHCSERTVWRGVTVRDLRLERNPGSYFLYREYDFGMGFFQDRILLSPNSLAGYQVLPGMHGSSRIRLLCDIAYPDCISWDSEPREVEHQMGEGFRATMFRDTIFEERRSVDDEIIWFPNRYCMQLFAWETLNGALVE
ncbi:MAG: serine protease [Pseudomonadota bacterium]